MNAICRHNRYPGRQRGVAVVTALLLTTLAITIVASLFWQQQVQVRLVENQRYQLQKQWVLRGALDWAQLILREDKRFSTVDHLGEPWAVPLAPTRLDQYVENQSADGDVGAALLSGYVIDAQSRFNLTNLATQGRVDLEAEVPAFRRLLINLGVTEQIAVPVAEAIAAAQPRAQTPPEEGTVTVASKPSMPLLQVDDLLSVPGVTPEILAKLRDFVIILPEPTPVNANTAPAPVLAARIEELTLSQAEAFVVSRERAYVLNRGDLARRLTGGESDVGTQIDIQTEYFIVNGMVRLGRGALTMSALVKRPEMGQAGIPARTTLVWMREN